MTSKIQPLFRPATPPEDPSVKWRGFDPGSKVLPAGSTYSRDGRRLTCDIRMDRDLDMQLRDGTRIYLDLFRPVTDEPLPVILVWSPYGKQGGFWEYDSLPGRAGVPDSATSGLEKFEGPDPAFWCANDYAIVNVDPRGVFASEGDVQFWSELEIQDGYDVIEWIAAQPWCTGSVAMAGNSWLTIMQWKIASARPPHLAAIAPWEGLTDIYRDQVLWGGIPRLEMTKTIARYNAGRGLVEDVPKMAEMYPLMNDYWRSKITDIESIEVPAYVVSGWTNWLHTRGTLDAFTRLDPARSWLRVHNTFEWPDQYAHEHDLLRFFDHFLKGKDNGWEATPRVRLSVLDPGGLDQVDRAEASYPLARAVATPFYLDATDRSLSSVAPATQGELAYHPGTETVVFDLPVEQDLEIVGPMKLRLWLEVEAGDDADVYVYVRKADDEGKPLLAEMWPGTGVSSLGAHGRLRASHRELDVDASKPLVPVHQHVRRLPLTPGEPVALDIPIWPYGMAWHAGQRLQVVLSGRDLMEDGVAPETAPAASSASRIVIRTGASFDSHLLVPVTG